MLLVIKDLNGKNMNGGYGWNRFETIQRGNTFAATPPATYTPQPVASNNYHYPTPTYNPQPVSHTAPSVYHPFNTLPAQTANVNWANNRNQQSSTPFNGWVNYNPSFQ